MFDGWETADFLGLYAAILSTVLLIIDFIRRSQDKPLLTIRTQLVYTACTESNAIKGLRIHTPGKGWQEVLLEVSIANAGTRALQVTSVIVALANGTQILRIIPDGLPRIIEPNTSVDVQIQKGWLEFVAPIGFGVLDAFGRGHMIQQFEFVELVNDCKALPPEVVQVPGEPEPLFQAKDDGRIVRLDLKKR